MSPGTGPSASELAALQHLAHSRQQLRQALPASHPASQAAARPVASGPAQACGPVPMPTAGGALRQALAQAWQQHPAHQGAELAAGLARLALHDLAERQPLGLVLGAGLLGMVVAHSQPWRFLIRPALRSGWPARLALDVLAQVPMQHWVAAWAASAADRPRPSARQNPRA